MQRRLFLKNTSLTSLSLGLQPFLPAFAKTTPPPPLPSEILRLPVRQLAALIRQKELTSYEIVAAFLDRIEAVNPRLNAVVAFRPEEAIQEARQADEDLMTGRIRGPLHGVPCTIKDSFDTAGILSTGGTLGRKGFIPKKDATVVRRLKEAGAIIMGKTNTPEFTMAFTTDNLVYGRTNNPYNPGHTPGGSSGGAAAIIAAHASPFDIGTDTGGSIRFPAHCTGITGIKPTTGRVPRTGHIVSYEGPGQSATHVGPMAKYVDDLALLLRIIAGPDGVDPYVYPVPLRNEAEVDLRQLRFAFYTDNGLRTPSEETVRTVERAIGLLRDTGAEVRQAIPDGLSEAPDLLEAYLYVGDWLGRMLDHYGTTETQFDWMKEMPHPTLAEYQQTVERVDRLRSRMRSFWQDHDVLICPVSPEPAPVHHKGYLGNPYYSYTAVYNLTGWPGAVVRGGTSAEGLPIGVQILAAPWREDVCLAVAGWLEKELGAWPEIEIRK